MAATLNRTHIRSPTIIHFNDGPKELIVGGFNTEKLKTTPSVAPSTTFSRHFRCRSAPARSFQPNAALMLPNTERVAARLLSLPTGTAVGEKEIRLIAQIIKTAIRNAREVRQHLDRLGSTISEPTSAPAVPTLPQGEPERVLFPAESSS